MRARRSRDGRSTMPLRAGVLEMSLTFSGDTMHNKLLTAAGILCIALLAACNNAKSPEAVANDTAAAQSKAAKDVADAQKDAATDNAKIEAKVDDKSMELANTEAKGAYDVATKKADGMHDVALEKCKLLDGAAQKKCKDQADADYDAAKANAKRMEVSKTQ
jgi:hypothetical protein